VFFYPVLVIAKESEFIMQDSVKRNRSQQSLSCSSETSIITGEIPASWSQRAVIWDPWTKGRENS